jgi:uncharacterized BrkB/YihY/UPF0761 family membrane protein
MIDIEKCPRTYLGLSLIATFIFLSPLGLFAILNAVAVKRYWEDGDIDEAMKKSKKARIWSWVSILANILFVAITLYQTLSSYNY